MTISDSETEQLSLFDFFVREVEAASATLGRREAELPEVGDGGEHRADEPKAAPAPPDNGQPAGRERVGGRAPRLCSNGRGPREDGDRAGGVADPDRPAPASGGDDRPELGEAFGERPAPGAVAGRRAASLNHARAVSDNLAVLELIAELRGSGRRPDAAERDLLEHWHGWGAAPQFFDAEGYAEERERLRVLVGVSGLDAARRTVLNAHYTDPMLVEAMWEQIPRFGVTSGAFIEPGCGRGSFLSAAPADFVGLGVELDATTAEVASLLAPERHEVVAEDFADVEIREGRAAAAIGNVPFGKLRLFDRRLNRDLRLSIHDHFILKGLAGVAPGGVAMFITSRYTLDKRSSYARREIGRYGDFLGAVRLNSKAHAAEAGTDVVTDVVVFRRRETDSPANHAPGYLDPVERFGDPSDDLYVSRYFGLHPERVLGAMVAVPTMYRRGIEVEGTREENTRLGAALASIADERAPVAPDGAAPTTAELVVRSNLEAPIGRIERISTGFRRYGVDGWQEHDAGPHAMELGRLIEIRDLARSLVDLERLSSPGDEATEQRRRELAGAYAAYVAAHGPINRVKLNEQKGRRSYPRMGGFRSDPDFPRVAALERYDEATNVATPAALLARRVVAAPEIPEHLDNPADALAISLAERGRIDRGLVASLLDIEAGEVDARLGDLVFADPERPGALVERAAYLAGNVKAKLAAAQQAVEQGDERFSRNVESLAAVIPPDLTANDLERVLGASWIDEAVIEEFARSFLRGASKETRNAISVKLLRSTGEWIVRTEWTYLRSNLGAGHEFGTPEMDALTILQHALNGRSPVVSTKDDQGRMIVLPDATQAAMEKAELIREAFDDWLLRADPDRSAAALAAYNERFNSYVPRSYAGMKVSPPGLASHFQLRDHQHAAIARAIFSGNTAIWHEVGAGKTAVQIIAAMEMMRLGLINRPAFAVLPNMLHQFARDIVDLFPAADVLVIDKDDISPANRALFAARVRSHDWDAVVITHPSLTRWNVGPEVEREYLNSQVRAMRAELQEIQAQGEVGRSAAAERRAVKTLERCIANFEGRIEAFADQLADRQDEHEFPFDEAGIDFLIVDEADEFKNAEIHSAVRDLRGVPVGPGSQRALDLSMKLHWLRRVHPERQTLHATGTPISNTVAEIWVAMRYLRPDLLEELGIDTFDSFRMQFTDTVSAMELDLTRSYRRVERLARYKNLPELARILSEFADIVMAEDIGLPKPAVAGGKREVVLVPPSPQLEEFITGELTKRVEKVRGRMVEPEEDNMLKLSSEARFASFDWTAFRGEAIGDQHSTIAAAARRIASLYEQFKDSRYLTETGAEHPRPGALHLVFCDLSTPNGSREHSAYEDLRRRLVERGVPRELISFAHEHDKNDETKSRMQEMARDGRIAVLIGSTAKLGAGLNVQARVASMHHLDCPWRPRDVEQREGRGIRQGNQNDEVAVLAYVTARSYYVYGWQTIERKAGFTGQLLRATPDGPRSLVVSDEEALSYGEIKAVATGDPDFLRESELQEKVARLERLERSHFRARSVLSWEASNHRRRAAENERFAEAFQPFAEQVAALDHEKGWTLEVDGRSFVTAGEAADYVAGLSTYSYPQLRFVEPDASFRIVPNDGDAAYRLTASMGISRIDADLEHRQNSKSIVNALRLLARRLRGLPEQVRRLEAAVQEDLAAAAEKERARALPFSHQDELEAARGELRDLRRVLQERYAPDEAAAEDRLRAEQEEIDAAMASLPGPVGIAGQGGMSLGL